MAKKQKLGKGLPIRHYNAAKKARHQRCWLNSQRKKERNRKKQEKYKE